LETIGWLGFGLIQLFYIPQIIRTVRTRDVKGLSLFSWVVLWLGLLGYLVYSVWRHDPVFMAGNAIGLLQSSLQVILIWRYRT
jgi:MtN3 and saliva related transmembrane protein